MKRILYLLFFCFLLFININSQSPYIHGRLQVSEDGHHLRFADGTPFFWLGDTGWELFHRLTLEEIKLYLDNRKAKGFNVIQCVILAEQDGLRVPNQYGELPLIDLDPTRPNEKYFNLIDTVIEMAKERDIFLALLPTWGDKVVKLWGVGPEIFDTTNAYIYGKWLGNRYKNKLNIIWILGGDRPAIVDNTDYRPIWRAMAKGIKEATGNQCIISYHPSGEKSSSFWFNNEDWIDFHMIQSGHGGGKDLPTWEFILKDYNSFPSKPTLDGEPNYEDHPVKPWPKWNIDDGYYRDYDVRRQLYRSVFAGACGVTYGHHSIWQFMNAKVEAITYPDRGWINALDRPGAFQAGYLRKLIESKPSLNRIPDNNLIIEGQGIKHEYIQAFRSAEFSYAMIYIPVGKKIKVDTKSFAKKIKLCWFNPRNGEYTDMGVFKNNNFLEITPPSTGYENDWVLIIESVNK